jgi:hypothetical protein
VAARVFVALRPVAVALRVAVAARVFVVPRRAAAGFAALAAAVPFWAAAVFAHINDCSAFVMARERSLLSGQSRTIARANAFADLANASASSPPIGWSSVIVREI